MSNSVSIIDYYAQRANEYERIYQKPERQSDLAKLKQLFQELLSGQSILEIACGTGYWTQAVSQTASSITATDFNEEVLQIARKKDYGCTVDFRKADAFALNLQEKFSAGLAVAWWSHLQKSEVRNFLSQFHRQFPAGAQIVFMDNRFVTGSNTPISRVDEEGNTYQLRKLENGSEFEVLKNFPTRQEAEELIRDLVAEFSWTELTYYWVLTYKLK